MNTQEMIQEIQEKIADKTLSFGCELLRQSNDWYKNSYYILWPWSHSRWRISSIPFWSMDIEFDWDMISKSSWDWYENIWHPVSLSRVLSALGIHYGFYQSEWYSIIYHLECQLIPWEYISRKLLKEDWSDAHLQDQSDETIQALHGLLVR